MRQNLSLRHCLVAVMLGVLAPVAFSSPAHAAMCAKWDQPERVDVGGTARVSFRTYLPISTGGNSYTLRPRAFPDYPFQVEAYSPTGEIRPIQVTRSPEDRQVWAGDFTPDQPGPWTLVIVNFHNSDDACYGDVVLSVTDTPANRLPIYAAFGFTGLLVAFIAAALTNRRRSGPH